MLENGTNQQSQPIQAPALPVPQEPGFMRSDPNDLSFLFNEESGQLEIVPKTQLTQPTQTDEKFQAAVEQKAGGVNGAQDTSTQQQSDSYEDRFSKIENAFGQLVAYLQGQEQSKLNNLTPQSIQEQQPDYSGIDFSDPNNIVALINHSVQNAIKQYAQPMQQAADQVKVKNSFDFAAAKYGQDFLNVLPKIQILVQKGILKSDPNVSFEDLYLAFKQMETLNGNTAKSDSTIQPVNGYSASGVVKPQQVQQFVQKANALSTETGGVQRSIINNDKPKITSVDDAFNQAWDSLYGGR